MPHALRIYRCLKTGGLVDRQAMCLAEEVERARADDAIFDRQSIIDRLCDTGFTEDLSESLCLVLRNCYLAQRFATHFKPVALKTSLVRAKMPAFLAEDFIAALDPCVVAARTSGRRQPVLHQLPAGRVVMCDFTFLRKPEMQKERRNSRFSAVAKRYRKMRGRPRQQAKGDDPKPSSLPVCPRRLFFFSQI
jgi:hypothetical protein